MKYTKLFGSGASRLRITVAFTFVLIGSIWIQKGYAGATYYIDFASGNDASAGTSTSTAWRHIPGTRNAADTDDISTSWGGGTINSSNKVPAGTIFKIKSGTTHNSSNGGRIYLGGISSSFGTPYYATDATNSNPITFQRDTTWGTGSVAFDGTGMRFPGSGSEAVGMFFIGEYAAFKFDGVAGVGDAYDGIIIQNVANMGIGVTSASGSVTRYGPQLYYVKFYNVATLATSGSPWGGSRAVISITSSGGPTNVTFNYVTLDHVEINGNGVYTNGFCCGQDEPSRCINSTVSNSIGYNLNGTDDNDAGIVWKSQNSQITYTNVTGYNSAKGFDNGEEAGGSVWDIIYKLVNCKAYDNSVMGAGFSNSSTPTDHTASYYIINSIFYGNNGPGVKAYAGPYNAYVVNNVFDNNNYNILMHCDGDGDTTTINVYYYNNVFYHSTSTGDWGSAYWYDDGKHPVAYTGDYNSYVQGSETYAIEFGAYMASTPFSWGANGPGHASGTWYNFKSWHNDSHSKGTGATDTTTPPFTNQSTHDYTLTTTYAGTNLSGQSWYTADMGLDRNGNVRSKWNIGPYEYSNVNTPSNLRVIQ